MKLPVLFLLIALVGRGLAGVPLTLEKRASGDTRCVLLGNSLLQVGVAPAASASIVSLKYLPGGNDLAAPFQFKVEKDDLLPDVQVCNNVGGRTVLWGSVIFGTQNFKVLEETLSPEAVKTVLRADYYQHVPVSLTREITLCPDSTAVHIRAAFRNMDKAPRTVTPWENMLSQLNAGSTDEVIMPSRAGVDRINGRGVKKFVRDQLWRERQTRIGAVMTAAARNWIARRNADVPLVLAIRTSWRNVYPEGMFYSWHNETGRPCQTSEIIFNSRKLKPGEQYVLEYEYLVFPGLRDIREIVGPYGVDCRQNHRGLDLELAVVCPVESGSLALHFISEDEGKIEAGSRMFKDVKPGSVCALHYSIPELKAGKYRVGGRFASGEHFELLEPVLIVP